MLQSDSVKPYVRNLLLLKKIFQLQLFLHILLTQGCLRVLKLCKYFFNNKLFSSPFFFPILETDHVLEQIMEAILTNSNELFMPKTANLYLFLKG